MKAVLMSIRPKWCELIVTGNKTVEVRKTKPKLETPFKVYIYCTVGVGKNAFCLPVSHKRIMEHYAETGSMDSLNAPIGNGKVIGEFVCDRVYQYASDMFRSTPLEGVDISTEEMVRLSCLTVEELYRYEHSAEPKENRINLIGVYGWHISDLKIYDEPKPLSVFYKECAGLDNTGMCYECENAVGEECDCAVNGRLHLARPPQSWCYVEELL